MILAYNQIMWRNSERYSKSIARIYIYITIGPNRQNMARIGVFEDRTLLLREKSAEKAAFKTPRTVLMNIT